MKLRYSPFSPYVRKVMAVAMETGLEGKIQIIPTDSRKGDPELAKENPLSKVPTLTTDGGEMLYDSRVICEYLDSLHDGAKLFPPAGGARWTALRRQALADGIMDAALLGVYENLRPEGERSADWIARQKGKIAAALDVLEEEADDFGNGVDIGLLTIGCALGYLDLRYADDSWRSDHPALADWLDVFGERKSMTATAPKGPS
ncbi:MAG: glutathione S-transferase [Rhodospirillaceae bacterium]|nr:glutathione S-transferase [Rhodospirillaceae bacterium]